MPSHRSMIEGLRKSTQRATLDLYENSLPHVPYLPFKELGEVVDEIMDGFADNLSKADLLYYIKEDLHKYASAVWAEERMYPRYDKSVKKG